MSFLAPRDEAQAPTREVLQEVRLELGEVPELFGALASAPPALRGVWGLVTGTLLFPGRVPRTTKELIALAAAALGRVPSLAALFERCLVERGLDPEVLRELKQEGDTARLPDRTRELLAFARRAALQPALLGEPDYARLRRLGVGDEELAELVATAGAVALLINLSRSLGCL